MREDYLDLFDFNGKDFCGSLKLLFKKMDLPRDFHDVKRTLSSFSTRYHREYLPHLHESLVFEMTFEIIAMSQSIKRGSEEVHSIEKNMIELDEFRNNQDDKDWRLSHLKWIREVESKVKEDPLWGFPKEHVHPKSKPTKKGKIKRLFKFFK